LEAEKREQGGNENDNENENQNQNENGEQETEQPPLTPPQGAENREQLTENRERLKD
jgi:hypothetical protein